MHSASEDASAGRQRGDSKEFPLLDDEYRYLTSIVYDRSGIVLGANKVNMVYSRLVRRLRELRLASFRDYCTLLESDKGVVEIGFLINAITTNLTSFFRENHHFEHLRNTVLGDIARGKAKPRIRIWSAGCSSGEEPYSIAMTLADTFPDFDRCDARILATDLDTTMVATGKAGLYPAEAVAELPGATRAKFFRRPVGEKCEMIEPVKRLIAFKHLNLLGAWPMKGPFDAIFCRNVMIYFDGPTKAALVARYAGLLKPEGWLYIGHSESLLDNSAGFRLAGRTIYRKSPA